MNQRESNPPSVALMTPLLNSEEDRPIRIGLITVGGTNSNTVAAMAHGLIGVACTIAIDRDSAALQNSGADRIVLIGAGDIGPISPKKTHEMARKQANDIDAAIDDLDLVLIVASMYGATGQGISPVVAEVARRRGIATLAIVMVPTEWQGESSRFGIDAAVRVLQRTGATVFPIPSKRIGDALVHEENEVVKGIENLFTTVSRSVNQSPHMRIDLEDLPSVLHPGGIAAMGVGSAAGTDRAAKAAQRAIDHPLLGAERLRHASGVLVNTRGKAGSMRLTEVKTVMRLIRSSLPINAPVLYITSNEDWVRDELVVIIVITVSPAHQGSST